MTRLYVDYRTVSGVNGPLVILDNIKVNVSSYLILTKFLSGSVPKVC